MVKPGGGAGLLPAILAAYQVDEAAVPAEVVVGGWGEEPAMLRDGRADVALLRSPFDDRGLDHETLLTEPRVAMLPAGHRLAARRRLRMPDFAGETLPRWPGADAASAAFWAGRDEESRRGPWPAPVGEPTGDGPAVADLAQLLEVVALSGAVAFVPASVGARYPRPDLAFRPVTGLSPVSLLVAWPSASRSLAVAAFVRAAVSVTAAHPDQAGALL